MTEINNPVDAKRSQARLLLIRYGFPTLALALLVIIFAWPQISRHGINFEDTDVWLDFAARSARESLVQASAESVTIIGEVGGVGFSLEARRAEASGRTERALNPAEDSMLLEGVRFTWQEETPLHLYADSARHDPGNEETFFENNLRLESVADGTDLRAPSGTLEWRSRTITLAGPVEGVFADGALRADNGARIEDGGARIFLLGASRVELER
ncbi:MAG: hypothetical protein MPK06_04355 [Alphaproteobacteria bacterium]|nr:hypothetical protein [Alphaproteobacteria bacterium]MDA8003696.1 hypothetical protein [Alphaproteobacteria bacterium]MDA8005752.1 hypothetical protein [Alphaproteobacteria bacterium]MDA8013099.1 hypothetical protein [Alphaproteobacteria bacterium]